MDGDRWSGAGHGTHAQTEALLFPDRVLVTRLFVGKA